MALFGSFKKLFSKKETIPLSTDSTELETTAQDFAVQADSTNSTTSSTEWQQELTIALRSTEPKLSAWLACTLETVTQADANLWQRLHLLLSALEVPQEEAQNFVKKFEKWLKDMEYTHVKDFRSELQYRLALALDMEDEEDERSRLLLKLSDGLAKTREQIFKKVEALISSHTTMNDPFWEELEEIFLMADVGFEPTQTLIERLRSHAHKKDLTDPTALQDILAIELNDIFDTGKRITAINAPEVILMVGVNGVGKTTTIAKLAYRAQLQGKKILIVGADTFRAAAIEQLETWAKRLDIDFFSKGSGSDPAAVAFEAIELAQNKAYDLVFIDTAGRLQNKTNLMEELQKIRRVIEKKHPGAPHRTILVVDATTGQNALSQTKLFQEIAGVNEIILTKLDGTAKGGIAIAITLQYKTPITFIGLGEKMEDLRPFNGKDFATALLGGKENTTEHA